MRYIQFSVPPLPHYLNCGEATFYPNDGHVNRKAIGVFDLIVVTSGTLYITEDNHTWTVGPGQELVLRPDGHHYSPIPCKQLTHIYWLHFHSSGQWLELPEPHYMQTDVFERSVKRINEFKIHIPKYCTLRFPNRIYMLMRNLMLMMHQPTGMARWREQSIFQDMLQQFNETEESLAVRSSIGLVAEKVALYLRQNYKNNISYEALGEAINYNPTYISRCMKKVFHCTPLEYLKRFRIEKAKNLLINTDLPISVIAEEVGFSNISYFIKCFSEYEKLTPKAFRGKYRAITMHNA